MTKAFSLLIILAMAVQFIRPLGLPGLKKRSDAWKLAVAALLAIMLVAVTKESDARPIAPRGAAPGIPSAPAR